MTSPICGSRGGKRSSSERPTIEVMMRSSLMSFLERVSMVRPSRITVTLSATRFTSLSLCEIRIEVMPCRLNSSRRSSSAWLSFSLSEAVGSSRISSFTSLLSALAISTSCCLPTPILVISVLGSSLRPTFLSRAPVRFSLAFQSMTPKVACSLPRKMFSAIDSIGTRASSWWMMTMPICSLSWMPLK